MTGLWVALAADIVAIGLLSYGVYFRRHFRADLLLAYVALNIGVLVVTAVLTGGRAGLGLGLGLFGILSIIRLRSTSITQQEVAYYFVSLAMGLVAGLHPYPVWLAPVLCGLLVAVMFVVDHPRMSSRTLTQTVTLDHAYPDLLQVRTALEQLLGGEVKHVVVSELDMVRDVTVVDVRYRAAKPCGRPAHAHDLSGRTS